jgi:hypothetical protein
VVADRRDVGSGRLGDVSKRDPAGGTFRQQLFGRVPEPAGGVPHARAVDEPPTSIPDKRLELTFAAPTRPSTPPCAAR